MICKTCGKLLDEQATVCDACGAAVDATDETPSTNFLDNYDGMFAFPPGPSDDEKRRHFDFAWDSQEFHKADYKKRETIELRWDENAAEKMRNAPLNPFAAAIGETVREKEAADADKKRTEESRNIFEDDIFDLRQSESEESRLRFSKKNEEFQELLDQEVEKIQRRQKEIDEERNRIESGVMEAPVATPSVLASGEKRKSIDERIAEFIEKSDREMLDAMRQRLNDAPEPESESSSDDESAPDESSVFTFDDIVSEEPTKDDDLTDVDTKKLWTTDIFDTTPAVEPVVNPRWFEVTTTVDEEFEEAEEAEAEAEAEEVTAADADAIATPFDIGGVASPIFGEVAQVTEVAEPVGAVEVAEVAEPVEVAEVAESAEVTEVAEPVEVAQVAKIAEPNEAAEVIEPTDDPTLFESGWASPFDAPASVILGEVPESSPSPLEEAEANEEIKPPHELPDFVYGDLPTKDVLPAYVPHNEEVKKPDFFDKPIVLPFGNQDEEEVKEVEDIKEEVETAQEVNKVEDIEEVVDEVGTVDAVGTDDKAEVVGPGFVDFDSPILNTPAPIAEADVKPVFNEKLAATAEPKPVIEPEPKATTEPKIEEKPVATAEPKSKPVAPAESKATVEPKVETKAEPKPEVEVLEEKEEAVTSRRWLFYTLNILAVIVVLLIVFFAFMKFVPDSGFGIIANNVWDSVTGVFSSDEKEKSKAVEETTPAPEEEIIPPTESKDILIAGQLFNNAKVEYIYFDPLAARDSTMAYKISAANSAAGIVNNLWKKTDAGNLLYDEQAVAAVIRYNSDLCRATGGESTDILKDIAPGSPEETKMVDYMVDVSKLEFKKLGIGDILTDEKYFYVWTSEEGVETIERKEQSFERKTLYQLAPDEDVLKVYDHVSI